MNLASHAMTLSFDEGKGEGEEGFMLHIFSRA